MLDKLQGSGGRRVTYCHSACLDTTAKYEGATCLACVDSVKLDEAHDVTASRVQSEMLHEPLGLGTKENHQTVRFKALGEFVHHVDGDKKLMLCVLTPQQMNTRHENALVNYLSIGLPLALRRCHGSQNGQRSQRGTPPRRKACVRTKQKLFLPSCLESPLHQMFKFHS